MKISSSLFKESSELRIYHGTSVEALLSILSHPPVEIRPSTSESQINSYVFFFSFPSHYGDVSISYPVAKIRPEAKIRQLILNNMREAGVDNLQEISPHLDDVSQDDFLHLRPSMVLDLIKNADELELLWKGPFPLLPGTEIEVSHSSKYPKATLDKISELAKKNDIPIKFL